MREVVRTLGVGLCVSVASCTLDFYDMPVIQTYSWLPYPPNQPFWYSDQNTLSCFCVFLPPSGEAQLVCFMYQGSISSGGFLITSGLTLARIQSTTALEMISHYFTSHELCDLLSATPFTLSALSPLDMAILISDYLSWFNKWGFKVYVWVKKRSQM